MTISSGSILLTKKQEDIVNYRGLHLVIKGIPGSGKTVVLLRRARKLALENPSDSVTVFTYNKALAKYSRQLVQGLKTPRIQVVTFHSWARAKLRRLGIETNVIVEPAKRHVLREILRKEAMRTSSRVLERNLDFWLDEVQWIKGKMIPTIDMYQKIERAGRGTALRAPERSLVWGIFQEYQLHLREKQLVDWDDFAPALLDKAQFLAYQDKFDHVLVDEAQDLHEAQLRLLREIARKTLTIVADEAQQIYRTSFTWKGIGVSVAGNGGSKRLESSFRSTKQIIALASNLREKDYLVKKNDSEAMQYVPPEIEGVKPTVAFASSDAAEDQFVLGLVRQLAKTYSSQGKLDRTIGIVARNWQTLDQIQDFLSRSGVETERIKDEDGSVLTPGVKVTSLHSAKGLEFDIVIAMRLNDGIIPPAPPKDLAPEDLQDYLAPERRLLYVCMTRAKFDLYLTHSSPRSRFIAELEPVLYNSVKA